MSLQRTRMRLGRFRAWMRRTTGWIPRPVRRVIVGVIGGTLLLLALIGFIMPVMPGFIFVPFGLAILAVEFTWAARWLKKVKRGARSVRDRMRGATPAAKTQEGDSEAFDEACTTTATGPPRRPAAPSIIQHRPNAAA